MHDSIHIVVVVAERKDCFPDRERFIRLVYFGIMTNGISPPAHRFCGRSPVQIQLHHVIDTLLYLFHHLRWLRIEEHGCIKEKTFSCGISVAALIGYQIAEMPLLIALRKPAQNPCSLGDNVRRKRNSLRRKCSAGFRRHSVGRWHNIGNGNE